MDGVRQNSPDAVGLSGSRQTAPTTSARTIRPPCHRHHADDNYYNDYYGAADHCAADHCAADYNCRHNCAADHYSRNNYSRNNHRALTQPPRVERGANS